ncbi:MAG: hypothetical protein H0V33_00085, partial [Acidimicrobiia bacterium]|nr:hypothetical protein [Acidimicrobiia bacterium]
VTLGPRPDNPAVAFLGVGTGTRGFDAGLPFAVDIDSGQVGGPSAEYEAALDHAHGMRIEAVDDLAQALGVLDDLGGNALALGSPGTEAAAPPG